MLKANQGIRHEPETEMSFDKWQSKVVVLFVFSSNVQLNVRLRRRVPFCKRLHWSAADIAGRRWGSDFPRRSTWCGRTRYSSRPSTTEGSCLCVVTPSSFARQRPAVKTHRHDVSWKWRTEKLKDQKRIIDGNCKLSESVKWRTKFQEVENIKSKHEDQKRKEIVMLTL